MHHEVLISSEGLTAEFGEGVPLRNMVFPKGFIDTVLRLRKPDIPNDPRRLDEELSERSDIAVLLAEFDYSPDELAAMRRGALAIIAAEGQLVAEPQKAGIMERNDNANNVIPMRGRGSSGQGISVVTLSAAAAK